MASKTLSNSSMGHFGDWKFSLDTRYSSPADISGTSQETLTAGSSDYLIAPFSLLGRKEDLPILIEEIDREFSGNTKIADAYPCTALQEGLMALSLKQEGKFMPQIICKLPGDVDITRFKAAWQATVDANMTMRTTFVQIRSLGLIQVVHKPEPIKWYSGDDLDEYLHKDRQITPEFGSAIMRYGLIDAGDRNTHFVWTFHHAVIDGWAMRLLLKQVDQFYKGDNVDQLVNFNRFIAYLIRSNKNSKLDNETFWSRRLENSASPAFPHISSTSYLPLAKRCLERQIKIPQNLKGIATSSTIIQAAWALLIGRYTNSTEAIFGLVLAGRTTPVPGVQNMNGPTFTTVPMRVLLSDQLSVSELLTSIHESRVAMKPYQHFGIQNISKLSRHTATACGFQNLLVIQPQSSNSQSGLFASRDNVEDHWARLNAYALMMQCDLTQDGFNAIASFDSQLLPDKEMHRILQQFEDIIVQFSAGTGSLLSAIEIPVFKECDDVMAVWDSGVEESPACVHDVIRQGSQEVLFNQAVDSWDGKATYKELELLSDQLAHQLQDSKVGPEIMVPLIFERSLWMIVAIMAVMKSGGTFVPLNPDHPRARIQGMVQQVKAPVLLCSERFAESFDGIANKTLAVGPSIWAQLPAVNGSVSGVCTPNNAIYVIFTSGSTGNPKGCIIEHATCCSTLKHMSKFFGIDSKSRFLQNSSYTFDGCILEILATLTAGGTICIPSEDEKMNDIATAMNKMQVNIAFLTPSFSRLINPSSVPTLKTLAIGGEKLVQDDINRWVGKLQLFNVYGPTECCVICIGHKVIYKDTDPSKIGTGFIGSYIVLNEEGQLARPGVIGELLIGGPNLARGYLNDPEKTAAAFVDAPSNISQCNTRHKKWYRTGDLVKFSVDGSLEYVGRKDSQGKLAGQRIEMGEVEYHLRQNLRSVVDLVAVIATPKDCKDSPFLAAFICFADKFHSEKGNTSSLSSTFSVCKPLEDSIVTALVQGLSTSLPRYMIPKVYIRLDTIPLNSSGKIDRQYLQTFAAGLTKEELVVYSGKHIERSPPATEREHQLQQLWSRILNTSPGLIGRNDSFIRLGGDSILAMKLVAAARKQRIGFTVAQVFQTPVLSDLAKVSLANDQASEPFRCKPAAYVSSNHLNIDSPFCHDLLFEYGLERNSIEDAYPCTPFQEGIMAVSLTQPGTYMAQHVFELPENLSSNLESFRAAWQLIINSESNSILRTRIIHMQSLGLTQVVIKGANICKVEENLDQYLETDRAIPMGLGAPLHRFAIISPAAARASKCYFIWTAHHAAYDAWSLLLTVKQFEEEYKNLRADISSTTHETSVQISETKNNRFVPFSKFVKSLQDVDQAAAKDFWCKQLLYGGEPSHFPAVKPGYLPQPTAVLTHQVKFLRKIQSDLMISDLIRTAWAITVSTYANSNDILFGTIMSGRTGSAADIASVIGPTITTVPIRHVLDSKKPVLELVHSLRNQNLEIMAFEQFGLSNIQRIDGRFKNAVNFQNLLVIQPTEHTGLDECFLGLRQKAYSKKRVLDTYALTMECSITSGGLSTKAIFDPNVIGEAQMNRILFHFEHILQQLCVEGDKTLDEINTISPEDEQNIWEWNGSTPELTESCVHDLIREMMHQEPQAQAVSSWDGDLTRKELDDLASRLAQHLVKEGVGTKTIIPILFNKSKWAIVSMLAIIKAGGSFLPCDPLQPESRLVSILKQVQINTKMVLCSAEHTGLCSLLLPTTTMIVVNDSLFNQLPEQINYGSRGVCPDDALYIIFTSGTTGTPKGIVVEHKAYCSGAKYHAKSLCFDRTSRLLQFASYSFDTSIEDILTTLLTGGCLCIPSEEERTSDLQGAIIRMKVNAADLTPSYINTLSPDDVPALKRLTVGGEPATSNIIKTWADKVHLINAYGVTECCVTSLVNSDISPDTNPANIGRAVGAVSWIVDATNSNRLVPIGAVGELLIEGPALARGYLNDEEKTNLSFIDAPTWARKDNGQRRCTRLYKTGDLVQYNEDGSINYLGRKDTQIHLAGQRIELGEIEHHLLSHPKIRNAVAVLPESGPHKNCLTALIEFDASFDSRDEQHDGISTIQRAKLSEAGFGWTRISDDLRGKLPAYMIPSVWLAIRTMPVQISGKLDRRRLSKWISSLPLDYRAEKDVITNENTPIPPTDLISLEISRKVADLVSNDLLDPLLPIYGNDMKLSVAGIDSIKMMTLASFLKKTYAVSVPFPLLVNHKTKFTDVAKHIHEVRRGKSHELATKVDLIAEFMPLNSQLSSLQCHLGVVFMTGATGFLGTQILRQLLSKSSVVKVITHVRGQDLDYGRQRIITSARSARWWSDEFDSKLEVWIGDLAQPMLGLSTKQWHILQKVDAIIHNGASVQWSTDYHTLKPANVGSTFDLLTAIATSQACPKFVYISGGRTFDDGADDKSTATKLEGLDGYSQTKFVAELLVRDFGRRASTTAKGSQVSIIKPGLIIGTKREGIANTGDFLWRYLAGAVRIGAYPRPDVGDWLAVSNVDRVANTAITVLQAGSYSTRSTFDIEDGIEMQDFWDVVNAQLDGHLRVISPGEWLERINIDIDAERESHPLWPVAYMLNAEGNLGKTKKQNEVDDSIVNEIKVAVGKNVDYLRGVGFLKIKRT